MVSEDDVARRWSRRRDQQHQHPCLFCRVNRPVNGTGTSYKCLDHGVWDMRTFNHMGHVCVGTGYPPARPVDGTGSFVCV